MQLTGKFGLRPIFRLSQALCHPTIGTRMKIWAILTGIATLASIASYFHTIWKDKTPAKLLLPALAIIFAGATGYFAFQYSEQLNIHNQAIKLSQSWPERLSYSPDNAGVYRGIVLRGMEFLEVNKLHFPRTYSSAEKLIESFGVLEKVRKNDANIYAEIEESGRLHEAAETMLTLIRSIANEQHTGT
jgi:hypothetical protein